MDGWMDGWMDRFCVGRDLVVLVFVLFSFCGLGCFRLVLLLGLGCLCQQSQSKPGRLCCFILCVLVFTPSWPDVTSSPAQTVPAASQEPRTARAPSQNPDWTGHVTQSLMNFLSFVLCSGGGSGWSLRAVESVGLLWVWGPERLNALSSPSPLASAEPPRASVQRRVHLRVHSTLGYLQDVPLYLTSSWSVKD